jgi:hypothetical protein
MMHRAFLPLIVCLSLVASVCHAQTVDQYFIQQRLANGKVVNHSFDLANGQIIWKNASGVIEELSFGEGLDVEAGALVVTGEGTVTSVGLSLPNIFTVTNSPVTGTGTLTGTLATQSANTIWAGPGSGSAAAPTFRALVLDDVSTALSTWTGSTALTTTGTITTGVWNGTAIPVAYGGTGAANASGARTNLGLVIGTDVQAYRAELSRYGTMATLASASSIDIGAVNADYIAITGTTNISNLGSAAAGTVRTLYFADELEIADNSNINLPGTSPIITATDDQAVFRSYGGGQWYCISYTRANGEAVVTGGHEHDAADITSGTLDRARLPTPDTAALGGVMRNTGAGGQFVNGIDTDGSLLYGNPSGAAEFNVQDYGAAGDARMVTDAVLTNGDTTVTSATANFTNDDVGKVIWGNNTAGGLALPLTTIASVTNSTTIEVADAPGASWTDIWLVFGTDDTAEIQAAAAAADAANPKGVVIVPRGGYVFSDVLFDADYASLAATYGVRGEGRGSTIFYPAPNHAFTDGHLFNYNANVEGGFFRGFSIQGANVTFDEAGGIIVMRAGSKMIFEDVLISRIYNTGHTVFVNCPGSYANFHSCHFEFSDKTAIAGTGALASFYDCYAGNSGTAVDLYAGNVQWTGGVLDECGSYTAYMQAGSRLDLHNTIVYGGAGQTTVRVDGGTLRATQTEIRPWWIDGANNATGLKVESGSTAYLSQTTLTGSGTGYGLNNAGTVKDGGNNTIATYTGSGTLANSTTQTQVFTADGTWTKPPGAKQVRVVVVGAGGGGGSGRKGADGGARCGGGGGAGGCIIEVLADAAAFNATESVTVGVGGPGGATVTANSTNGNAGTAGESSVFSIYTAQGGANGAGGTTNSGTGGATKTNGCLHSLTVANSSIGGAANTGGGAGAAGTAISYLVPTGGGAGGGITAANVAQAGGAGGAVLPAGIGTVTGGAAGAANTAGSAATQKVGWAGLGGGGGGGSTSGNGGNGANGGNYGGGGGGGGAAKDDVGNSGAGGNGADGVVVVTTYF